MPKVHYDIETVAKEIETLCVAYCRVNNLDHDQVMAELTQARVDERKRQKRRELEQQTRARGARLRARQELTRRIRAETQANESKIFQEKLPKRVKGEA